MSNTFGDDSDDAKSVSSVTSFSMQCKHCGEEFPLRNDDCKYSYDYHKISTEHLEFVKYLNIGDVYCSRDTSSYSTSRHSEDLDWD